MDKRNRQQIYILVRNAVIAFVVFLALVEFVHLINWKAINWEVVAPTILSLACSLGIWLADRYRSNQERKRQLASQLRAEQDTEIRQRQEVNLGLIHGLQESLDSTVITLATFEDELRQLRSTESEAIKRLSELEKDLETHREKYAHTGAENALRSQQSELYQLRAQIEGLSQVKETERRIDTVLEAVNQTNAQMERLRHIVRDLSGCLTDVEENEN